MNELIRTNDPALISFVEALLKEAGFRYLVADAHMSALDGSVGALPRRILVESGKETEARCLLADAELGPELRPQKK
ncbi:MAG TPA: hypothetical protein DDZ68_11115 [Parvularcula sp.]|nr:hypothetical protein [Parvularcula sp.]HBS30344.1 hypothetical protein [Parvularcula sp.]HBS35666.1 hypothetical protein [Parvularcula sp.]